MFEFQISLGPNSRDLLISWGKQTPESSERVKVIYIEANMRTSHKIYHVYCANSNNNIYNNTYARKLYIAQTYFNNKINSTKWKICKLKLTRKATGFKSLQVICWEINQVASKCQKKFWTKVAKKALKQKK